MTKHEIRMTKEARMLKHETKTSIFLVLRASDFFRHSNFVLRFFPTIDRFILRRSFSVVPRNDQWLAAFRAG